MPCSVLLSLLLFLSPALSLVVEEPVKEVKATLLGGWTILSPESEKAKALTGIVGQWYNRQSDSAYDYKAGGIKARMQVINGYRYDVDVIMTPTGCLKSENIQPENCEVPGSGDIKVERCLFYVDEIVPDFKPDVSAHQCVPFDM